MRFIGYLICFLGLSCSTAKAEDFDPFSQNSQGSSGQAGTESSIKHDVELIYRGTYIPNVQHQDGVDQTQHTVFVDGSLGFATATNGVVAVRGLLARDYLSQGKSSTSDISEKILEAYYEYTDADSGLYFSGGRKNMGWSSGFQWRPADLIDNGYSTKNVDMLDPRKYTGIDQIQIGMLGTYLDMALIASNMDEEKYHGKQLAAKMSYRSTATYSLLLGKNGELSKKLGFIIDTNLPFGSTLAVETIKTYLNEDMVLDPMYFGSTLESLTGENNYYQVFATVTQFYDDKRRTRIEYFYNGAGFSSNNFDEKILESINRYLARGNKNPVIDQDIFSEKSLRRNYIYGAYTGFIESIAVELEPNILINLDDNSYIGSISLKRHLGGKYEISARLNWFRGGKETEYGVISSGLGILVGFKVNEF